MTRAKYFLQSVNVLNVLLALATAAVVYGTVDPFLNPAVQISLPPVKKPLPLAIEKAAVPLNSPPADYAVVSTQNLFHPERKIPPEKQAEKAIPRPEVVLYGTLITAETSFAFVEDKRAPYSTAGRGKRQLTLRKGDNVSGYILSEIEPNRIVLVKGEDRITVMLDDRGKRRGEDASTAARTAAGNGATSPSLTPSAPQAPPIPARPAPSPRPAGIGPGSVPSPSAAAGAPGPVPSPTQSAPSLRPGIGASGTWPPTQSTVEQTQQKIREGQQMRSNQLQQK